MAKTDQFKALAVVGAVVLALCLLVVVAVRPAGAAYPGENGKIAFVSNRDVGSGEIYTIRPSGGAATRITFPNGGSATPAYSPDGTQIAFTRNSQVYVMNANGMKPDGSGARQVTFTTPVKYEPAWSPDGTKIVYVANSSNVDGQFDLEIWVTNADGTGTPRQLTNNTFPDQQPAWSPLGNEIAFVGTRPGDSNRNIYVMDADPDTTEAAVSITPNTSDPVYQGHDDDPSYSPDGEWIAYSNGMSGIDVWKIHPNGTGKTKVAGELSVEETDPAWSPDGDKMAYVSSTSGTDREIWTMNADGTNRQRIHINAAHDINPDWQPNSAPTITRMRPAPDSETTDRTPTISATVSDKQTNLAKTRITLSLDGETVPRKAFSYDRATDRLAYTPSANLPFGRHAVRITARDEMGLRTIEEWSFKMVR